MCKLNKAVGLILIFTCLVATIYVLGHRGDFSLLDKLNLALNVLSGLCEGWVLLLSES